MTSNQGSGPPPVDHAWDRHPWASLAIRGAVFLVPIGVALGTTFLLEHLAPIPSGWPAALAWWIALTLTGLFALFVVERLMRGLLPLAALLNVSLLFPDHAPKRFAVARKAVRPTELVARLQKTRQAAQDGDLRAAQTVLELTAALSVHDRRTRGHSERVRVLTDMISAELHLPERDRGRLRWAALLHDIGKLQVSSKILNKPAKPSESEWQVLRAHPENGAALISPVLPWLEQWGRAVVQHHEWFDGSGYPRGMAGHQISLGARIVSVADVYEVITAPRPYRRPISMAAGRAELVRVSGTQLDPAIVRALLNVSVGRLWTVIGIGSVASQLPLIGELSTVLTRVTPGLSGSAAAAGAAGAIAITGAGVMPVLAHHANAPTPVSVSSPVIGGQAPLSQSSGPGWVASRRHASSPALAVGPPPAAPTPARPAPPAPLNSASRPAGSDPAPARSQAGSWWQGQDGGADGWGSGDQSQGNQGEGQGSSGGGRR